MADPYNVVVIDELRSLLGDRVSTSDAVREHHSHGESWHAPGLPDVVVFPTSTDEVSAIVKMCAGTAGRSCRSAWAARSKATSTRSTAASRST